MAIKPTPQVTSCSSRVFKETLDTDCAKSGSYVGEVGLWVGIWALSIPALRTSLVPRYAWLLAGVSPLLTWFLLRKVSGVPPLEVRAQPSYSHLPS